MNRIVILITLMVFFGLTFLSACGEPKKAGQSETQVTSEDVKKEAKEAMQTAMAFTQEQKDEYLQQVENRMGELDKKFEDLQAQAQSKAAELKVDTKTKINQSMEELRSKKQAAAEKLGELKSTSGEAWDDIKAGMDSAINELSRAFDKVHTRIEEEENKN